MSSRKTYSLSLSNEAIEDFRDILSYTMQMWGEQQVEEYAAILHKALTAIEQNPLMGKDDLPPYRHVRRVNTSCFTASSGTRCRFPVSCTAQWIFSDILSNSGFFIPALGNPFNKHLFLKQR